MRKHPAPIATLGTNAATLLQLMRKNVVTHGTMNGSAWGEYKCNIVQQTAGLSTAKYQTAFDELKKAGYVCGHIVRINNDHDDALAKQAAQRATAIRLMEQRYGKAKADTIRAKWAAERGRS